MQEVAWLKQQVKQIRISPEIKRYLVDIVNATRSAAGVQLGASPRASLTLMKISQALALFDGNEFVAPENIQEIAIPVISHRIVMDPQARFSGKTTAGIVEEIISSVPVPA
jgi:MoxR-like ATPase